MPVYLDHNATTTLAPEVLDAMLPYLQMPSGNPSSVHRFGRMSREAIEHARQQLADFVAVDPAQVVFTSGGTESNNHVFYAVMHHWKNGHMAISNAEHPSVIEPAKAVNPANWSVDWISTTKTGLVDLDDLKHKITSQTHLVSIMRANNETGVIQPVDQVRALTAGTDCWIHSDATQAAGKIELSFNALNIDLMTLSAHKLYGPKGAGALITSKAIELTPMIRGGSQENGLRAGTENVAAIVGFGKAAELASRNLPVYQQSVRLLRDRLEHGLRQINRVTIFASEEARLPNTTLFSIQGIEGETLLMQLDKKGYAVSSGSACTSGKTEASHVLKAMSITNEIGVGAIRVSLGISNTQQEVDGFLLALREIIAKMLPEFSEAANH